MKTIELECSFCKNKFEREAKRYRYEVKCGIKNFFCTTDCQRDSIRKNLIKTKCTFCAAEIFKSERDINKSEKLFCNHSCRAKFYNKTEAYRKHDKIRKYKNVNCLDCGISTEIEIRTSENKYRCKKCRETYKKQYHHNYYLEYGSQINLEQKCNICKNTCLPSAKYCDSCRILAYQNSGRKVAAARQKRSKNERLFADKLKSVMQNSILTNELFFKDKNNNLWDADIIIPDLKIAIHWNGNWHYEYCGGKHSLTQVQSRDKIKYQIVEDAGFVNYIIEDRGKFSEQKVDEELEKFLDFLETRKT